MLIDVQDSNEKAEIQLEDQIKAKIFYKISNTIFILMVRYFILIKAHIVIVVLNLSQFSLLKGPKCLNTNFGLDCNSNRSNSESLDRPINSHNILGCSYPVFTSYPALRQTCSCCTFTFKLFCSYLLCRQTIFLLANVQFHTAYEVHSIYNRSICACSWSTED